MNRSHVHTFLNKAAALVPGQGLEDVSPEYQHLLEGHFHDMDRDRTAIPGWPVDLEVVPAARIRSMVGPWAIGIICSDWPSTTGSFAGCATFAGTSICSTLVAASARRPSLCGLHDPPTGKLHRFRHPAHIGRVSERLLEQKGLADRFKADCFPIVGNNLYVGQKEGVAVEDFIFPYPDGYFHCAVAFSVFTHLRSRAMANYVGNLGRVMRAGSRLCLSFYLLDNSSEDAGGPPWTDSPRRRALQDSPDVTDAGVCKVLRTDKPEYLVAYRLAHIRDIFRQAGFSLERDPLYGAWSGRPDFYAHQDYLIFRKDG